MDLEIAYLTAIVVGLSEVIKRAGVPSKYIPILALVIGVGFNFGFKFMGSTNAELLVGGILASLTACGFYDLGIKPILSKGK